MLSSSVYSRFNLMLPHPQGKGTVTNCHLEAPFSSIPFLVHHHHTLDLSSSKHSSPVQKLHNFVASPKIVATPWEWLQHTQILEKDRMIIALK